MSDHTNKSLKKSRTPKVLLSTSPSPVWHRPNHGCTALPRLPHRPSGLAQPSLCRLQGGLKEFIILSLQDTRRERARGATLGMLLSSSLLLQLELRGIPRVSTTPRQSQPGGGVQTRQGLGTRREGCLARSPASAKDREFSVFASQRQ